MSAPVQPNHAEKIMDADMLALWRSARSLPKEIRLYGGTGLALYLGHRASQDFDFVHADWGVDVAFVRNHMAPFNQGEIQGGPGMVDITHEGSKRRIMINVMEAGGSFVPHPVREPVKADNGVYVAHIDDLMAAKLRALMNRESSKDYLDTAACLRLQPDAVWNAMQILKDQGDNVFRILKSLSAPPEDVREACSAQELQDLSSFATAYLEHSHTGAMGPG